jgi:hypothetical protein
VEQAPVHDAFDSGRQCLARNIMHDDTRASINFDLVLSLIVNQHLARLGRTLGYNENVQVVAIIIVRGHKVQLHCAGLSLDSLRVRSIHAYASSIEEIKGRVWYVAVRQSVALYL